MAVFDSFLEYLSHHIELDETEQEVLKRFVAPKSCPKDTTLLEEGQISESFYFITKGFIRMYYMVDGEEKTVYFYPEGSFVSAYKSFVCQLPAEFYFETTEDSEILEITREASFGLLEASPKFERLARIFMEEELAQAQEMIASLLTLKPEQRFERLMEKNPTIFQRASQVQIASYIGVRAETLSRFKKRYLTS